MAFDQEAHHVECGRDALGLRDRGELGELLVGARRGVAQGANAPRDQIERVPQLSVLIHEHQVQRVENRTLDIPVKVVGLLVERVGVGQQARLALRDALAVLFSDANVGASGCDKFDLGLSQE